MLMIDFTASTQRCDRMGIHKTCILDNSCSFTFFVLSQYRLINYETQSYIRHCCLMETPRLT